MQRRRRPGDEALATRVRDAYLAYSDTMLDWFETLAKEDFARDIPQILVIHANDLHTDALDALLTRFEQRGYRCVTLGEAMKDAAYSTPDELRRRRYGPSWLHRWRDRERAAAAHERLEGCRHSGSSISFETTQDTPNWCFSHGGVLCGWFARVAPGTACSRRPSTW